MILKETEHESEPERDPVRRGRRRFAGVSRDGKESAVANCSERCARVRSPRQRRRLLFAVPPNSAVRQESRFPERQQRLGSMLAGAAIRRAAPGSHGDFYYAVIIRLAEPPERGRRPRLAS